MRGGNVCSVTTCKSNSKKIKLMGQHLKFFGFPTNPEMRNEWIRKCGRRDILHPENKRVCSKHFTEEDFEDHLKAKLLNLHPRKLRKTAIPSLFLPPEVVVKVEKSEPDSHTNSLLFQEPLTHGISIKTEPENDPLSTQLEDKNYLLFVDVTKNSTSHKSELDILKRHIDSLEQENIALKQQILVHEENEKHMKLDICNLKQELKETKLFIKNGRKRVSNQLDNLSDKKLKVTQNPKEL